LQCVLQCLLQCAYLRATSARQDLTLGREHTCVLRHDKCVKRDLQKRPIEIKGGPQKRPSNYTDTLTGAEV